MARRWPRKSALCLKPTTRTSKTGEGGYDGREAIGGRVAVEHGLDSKELMDVQVRCIDRDLDVQPTLWVAHEGEAH